MSFNASAEGRNRRAENGYAAENDRRKRLVGKDADVCVDWRAVGRSTGSGVCVAKAEILIFLLV